MEEKSPIRTMLQCVGFIAAGLLLIDFFILPGFISNLFSIIFGTKKSTDCGCGKKEEFPSMDALQEQNKKADMLKPQLKACLALEICEEEEVKIPVSRIKVREWKMQVMKNAETIFGKAKGEKNKTSKVKNKK